MTEEEEIEKEVKVIQRYDEIAEKYTTAFNKRILTLEELYETLTAIIKQRDNEFKTGKRIVWGDYWKDEYEWEI